MQADVILNEPPPHMCPPPGGWRAPQPPLFAPEIIELCVQLGNCLLLNIMQRKFTAFYKLWVPRQIVLGSLYNKKI